MMNAVKKRITAVHLLLAMLLFAAPGCSVSGPSEGSPFKAVVSGDSVAAEKAATPSIDNTHLTDNRYLYSHNDDTSVVTMYLTVSRGSASEKTDHSWADINAYSVYDYAAMGVDKYKVEGLLQVGNEKGPVAGQLGYGLRIPNATVQIRGATTSRMPQKSFKIELMKNSGEWNGQRTITLNKHVFDGLRFRNKLCYDLMEDIPDLVSLRTQFVHLYVKDDTDASGGKFVDYGLFTQVEQPNGRFLRNHELDSNGQLYKMNFFEFYRYPDEIRLKTDPKYDAKKFESVLEIKGNDDHSKLIAMLDDVNDYSIPITEVFEKYFDPDNYFTWLAFNIIVGNIDSQSRNNYLYSPLNSNKWYYICWDCDAALTRYEDNLINMDSIGYEYGISNYWGDVLFARVIQQPKYRAMLDEKVEAVRKIVTQRRLSGMAASYRAVAEKYLFAMPDAMHSEFTPKQYNDMVNTFSSELDLNYRLYQLSLRMPMPFYLDVPVPQRDRLTFKWEPAFDLNGQDVTYTFELAKDCSMKDIITRQKNLRFPDASAAMLKPGKYFFRVRATNESGNTQPAMVYYVQDDVKYYGVQCFYVLKDGSVAAEERHE